MTTEPTRPDGLPSFDELGSDGQHPAGTSWGVFPPGDQLGTLNFLGPESVLGAAGLVRRGQVFSLDYAVNAFEPFWSGTRDAVRHTHFGNNDFHHDDHLDGFFLQSTSQIDGLRHFGDPVHGFYGGATPQHLDTDPDTLGIHHWADAGIVGRGVLLDVARWLAAQGRPLDVGSQYGITASDLDSTAAYEGVVFGRGDIVVIRTGWAAQYLALTGTDRSEFDAHFRSPGLAQKIDTVRWVWDHRIALLAADNVGVERFPVPFGESDYFDPTEARATRGLDHRGMLHRPLISGLGLALGELWALEDLAEDCADDGVYEFLLTCKPLNVHGAAGSPANAIAIK